MKINKDMKIVIRLFIQTVAIVIAAYILPGIIIENLSTAILVAIILGVVTTFIKPVLVILTLPITLLSLGLFIFVINGVLVLLVSLIIPGFKVDNFLWALLFSLIVTLVSSFLNKLNK